MDLILKRNDMEFMKSSIYVQVKLHDEEYYSGKIRDVGDDGIALETLDRIYTIPFCAITYLSIKN